MGKYGGVNNARQSEGGVYFLPGNYIVEIIAVKDGQTRKKDDMFVVETKILWSDCSERKAGSECSWMTIDAWDTYLGHINHFCSVAHNIPEDDVDEPGVELTVSKENPLAGRILRVQASNVTKKNGEPFTKVKFAWPTPEDFKLIGRPLPEDYEPAWDAGKAA